MACAGEASGACYSADPMNQRHSPDPDDLAAFHAAIDGTTPLPKLNRVVFAPPKPSTRPHQRELDETAAINESLYSPLDIEAILAIGEADSFLRPGLPRTILRDLSMGDDLSDAPDQADDEDGDSEDGEAESQEDGDEGEGEGHAEGQDIAPARREGIVQASFRRMPFPVGAGNIGSTAPSELVLSGAE